MTYYEIIAKYHNIWQSSLDSSLVSAMNLLKLWLVVVEGCGLGASPLRRTDTHSGLVSTNSITLWKVPAQANHDTSRAFQPPLLQLHYLPPITKQTNSFQHWLLPLKIAAYPLLQNINPSLSISLAKIGVAFRA